MIDEAVWLMYDTMVEPFSSVFEAKSVCASGLVIHPAVDICCFTLPSSSVTLVMLSDTPVICPACTSICDCSFSATSPVAASSCSLVTRRFISLLSTVSLPSHLVSSSPVFSSNSSWVTHMLILSAMTLSSDSNLSVSWPVAVSISLPAHSFISSAVCLMMVLSRSVAPARASLRSDASRT